LLENSVIFLLDKQDNLDNLRNKIFLEVLHLIKLIFFTRGDILPVFYIETDNGLNILGVYI
ncbi:MAG: hypothetical protein AAFQ91_19555, partial [Cyanobacteria bacterium J06621_15]